MEVSENIFYLIYIMSPFLPPQSNEGTARSCRVKTYSHTLKYKIAFSFAFFVLFTAPSVFLLVEADVVALIARPEHNLQARTASRRIRRIRRING